MIRNHHIPMNALLSARAKRDSASLTTYSKVWTALVSCAEDVLDTGRGVIFPEVRISCTICTQICPFLFLYYFYSFYIILGAWYGGATKTFFSNLQICSSTHSWYTRTSTSVCFFLMFFVVCLYSISLTADGPQRLLSVTNPTYFNMPT